MQILLFGDQLTIAHSGGVAHNDKAAIDHLIGFIPAIAEWHVRMCLLQVHTLHAHIMILYFIS